MKKDTTLIVPIVLMVILISLILILALDIFEIPLKEDNNVSAKKDRANKGRGRKLNRNMNSKKLSVENKKPNCKSYSREEVIKKLKRRIEMIRKGKWDFEVKNEKRFYELIVKLKEGWGLPESKAVGYLKEFGFLVGMSSYFAKIVMKMVKENIFSENFYVDRFDQFLILSLGFSNDPNCIKFLKELYSYKKKDEVEFGDFSLGRLRGSILCALAHPKHYASIQSIERDYNGKDILFYRGARIGEFHLFRKAENKPSTLLDFLPYEKISSKEIKDFFIRIMKDKSKGEFYDVRVMTIIFLKKSLIEDNFQLRS